MADRSSRARDQAGAVIGLGVMVALAVVMIVGVPEDVGDRIVLPLVLAGLALAVALSRRRLRLLAAVLGAGIAAGLALGAGLRLAMLVAALMGGGVERSVGGTIGLIVFAVFPATVYSGAVALVRRLVTVAPSAASIVTAVLGGGTLVGPARTRAELSARGELAVNVGMFVAAFAVFGYLLVLLQRRIETWWDERAGQAAPEATVPDMDGAPA